MSSWNLARRVGAGIVAMGLCTASWAAGFTIDFSSAQGVGIATDKVLIQNIHVLTPVANPFGGGNTTVETDYNVIFTLDPNLLHLVPTAIVQSGGNGAGTCANVAVQVYNAVTGSPVSGASVYVGGRLATSNDSGVASFSGLAPSPVSVSVFASGYTMAVQNTSLTCASVNNVALALSPSSGQTGGLASGQFRVILTWGAEPRDLDSHMTGPNADASRWHVYYSDPSGGDVCGLDHDDTTSYGPETITCPATGTGTTLRNGVYRYSVHQYASDTSDTLGTSGASVRLEFGNGTVYNYTPPAGGWVGDDDLWTVFEITINGSSVSVAPVNTISHSVSPSSVAAPKQGAIQFGQPESRNILTHTK